jgi:hypothetical protein
MDVTFNRDKINTIGLIILRNLRLIQWANIANIDKNKTPLLWGMNQFYKQESKLVLDVFNKRRRNYLSAMPPNSLQAGGLGFSIFGFKRRSQRIAPYLSQVPTPPRTAWPESSQPYQPPNPISNPNQISVINQITLLKREKQSRLNWDTNKKQQEKNKIFGETQQTIRNNIGLIEQLPEGVRLQIFVEWLKLFKAEDIISVFSKFYYEKSTKKWIQATLADLEYEGLETYIKKEFQQAIDIKIKSKIYVIQSIIPEPGGFMTYITKILYNLQSLILECQDDDEIDDEYTDIPLFEKSFDVTYNDGTTIDIPGILQLSISVSYEVENQEEQYTIKLQLSSMLIKNIMSKEESIFIRGLSKSELYKELVFESNVNNDLHNLFKPSSIIHIPNTSSYTMITSTSSFFDQCLQQQQCKQQPGGNNLYALHKKYCTAR